MNKKKVIKKKVSVDFCDILDRKTPLQAFKAMAEYAPDDVDIEDCVFDIQQCGYDGGMSLDLQIMRWETDKEFEARKLKAEKAKKAKELKEQKKKERELKMLARLEEKYRK